MKTTTLHSEMSIPVGKKPAKELTLIVENEHIGDAIEEFEEILEDFKKMPEEYGHYMHSESGDSSKTPEEVIEEMEADIEEMKQYAQGLVKMTAEEEILQQISNEIHGTSYAKVDWAKYFQRIPKKKDGTFAIGRIVPVASTQGFSYEDMESYGRRGYEMVIKTISDTEAELVIRSGIIEKW